MKNIFFVIIISSITLTISGFGYANPGQSSERFQGASFVVDYYSETNKLYICTLDIDDEDDNIINTIIQVADPWTLEVETQLPIDGFVMNVVPLGDNNLLILSANPFPLDSKDSSMGYIRKIDPLTGDMLNKAVFEFVPYKMVIDSKKENAYVILGPSEGSKPGVQFKRINLNDLSEITSRDFKQYLKTDNSELKITTDDKKIYSVFNGLESYNAIGLETINTLQTNSNPKIIGLGNEDRLYVTQSRKYDFENPFKYNEYKEEILVIDCSNDQLVKTIMVEDFSSTWIELNPLDNKIYYYSILKFNPEKETYKSSREDINEILEIDPVSEVIIPHILSEESRIEHLFHAYLIYKPGQCRLLLHGVFQSDAPSRFIVYDIYGN